MPGQPPPLTDERALLLAYIAQQRDGIRNAAFGLSDEQARLTPTAGTLSIGGLVKHVAATEQHWMDLVLQRDRPGSVEDYVDGFRLRDDETLAGALAHYADVAQATEAEVNDIDDLNRPVPVPRGVPWFPQDVDAWSVRWVLLHVIEETARHAGHADIIRESIDGATMYALMAGVEGWPETAWLKPWRPPEGEAAEGARNTHCRRRRLRKSLSTVAALAALTGTQTAWAAGTPRATAASNASRDDNNPARQYTTPSVAVDPRNPMRVVISYMEARSRRCSIVVSNDGGSTWSRPDGSASPDGYPFCYELQFASFSNPEAFGRSRTLYQGLNGWDTRDGGANSGNVSAVLGRSDDLGESWKTTPVRDARGKAGTDVESNGPMHSVVVDTRTGSTDRVYVGGRW